MDRLQRVLLGTVGVVGLMAPAIANAQAAPASPPPPVADPAASSIPDTSVADERLPAAPSETSTADGAATPRAAGGDIVVTGSRIVRDGYTAPTPVTVATTEDLLKSTPSNIPDALNKLPQFANSLSPSKSANNFSNNPIHGNVLNLRALGVPSNNPKGPLRTLILFDGLRVSPTAFTGTIDTNVLPQLLMQRVDVVTGGASAAWGSDAVAGVVNFVLDKKFTGLKGVAQAGISERGDAANQRLGLAYGTSFADDRGHFLLSGEYNNTEGLLRSDRKSGRSGATYVGSVVGCTPPAGQPSTVCNPGFSSNPYTIANNVLISAVSPDGRITGSSVAGNPFIGRAINPGGTTRPFNTGTAVGTAGFQQGGDGYGIPADTNAIAPFKTYQSFARASFDVTPDVTVYAQGLFSRSDLQYITQQNALVPPSQAITIYRDNPFLPAAIRATLPTANDFITVGQASSGQLPVAKERTDYWLATAGVNGKLAGFSWNVSYSHGDSLQKLANSGLYDNKRLYAAVDVVNNPANGQPTCRVLLDPAVASQYAGCVPFNVLNGQTAFGNSAEAYNYVTGTSRYRARVKQDSVVAAINGSLFDLPAGPVDVAFGVEYRHQSLNLDSNANPATLAGSTPAQTAALRANYFAGLRNVPSGALYYWLTNVGEANGSLNVKEAFGEIAVPLLKDTPFFRELSVNGAIRVTDYSTSGTVTTWKAGGTWKPIDGLLLRGTYSRDIRAPNLFELFAGGQSGIGIVNDVRNATGTYGSGQNINVNSLTSGNSSLKPETAKTYTFGAVVNPAFLPGFSLAVDYYHIKVNGLIEQLTAQQIVTNCLNAGGSGVPECSFIDRTTPTSFPNLVRIQPANIAFLTTAGIDIDASYRTELGNGALGVRLYANYLDKFIAQQSTFAPVADYTGVSVVISNPAAYPRWRGNLTVDYTNGPFGVTVSEQYIHKMRLDIPGAVAPVRFVDDKVKAVFYTDLSFRFTIPKGRGNMEFFTTVNNLFDKQPPLIPGTIPGVNIPTNIAVYDFIGRAYTAGVRFKF